MSSNSHKATEKKEMLRRFERSELILHWANAVPFLILFITGGLNILSHFFIFSPEFLHVFRTIHKIVGPLWLVCIGFSFFFIGRDLNIANTLDQLGMGLSDITWMITALRSAYNPHIQTPPAGKFNTGQKINSDLVLLYVVAFAISGGLMLIFNTMLLPWFIHASVFFMAVNSVTGHLYLSFLHPSTRPGLFGIFTGMVPRSYIEHHHSLTLRRAAHEAHEEKDTTDRRSSADRSGYRVFMMAEIIILLLVLIGGVLGVKMLGVLQKLSLVERGFNSVINPGVLSKAHAIKEIDDCKKCHEYSAELPNEKCFSCHKLIKTRRDARLGPHGRNQDQCIHCHKEHPYISGSIINFDKEKFDHDTAAFKREGKHKDVKCEKCHIRKTSADGNNPSGYYLGLRYDTCLDCHKDFHKGNLGEKCETCHSVAGWQGKNLKFDHANAKFRLEGKHASVQCEKCHKPQPPGAALGTAVFRGLKFGRCDDCHKDPHRGELRADCTTCHSSQGWRGKDLKFDHGSAKFRLEGKHEAVKCAKCHRSKIEDGLLDVASFRLKHEICSDCHKDPHSGELNAKCSACHVTQGWRGKDLKFDHGSAKFRLDGKHETVKCVKCHRSTMDEGPLDVRSFRTKHAICTDCHKDPHYGGLNPKCPVCHVTQGWQGKNLKFNHSSAKFRLDGKHTSVKCEKCHKTRIPGAALGTADFTDLKFGRCDDCHKDPHSGELTAKCSACHSTQGWRGKDLKFDHGSAKFRLEGKHKEVKCVKCHRSNPGKDSLDVKSFRLKHEVCLNCHKDPHRGELRADCSTCHAPQGWRGKDLKFDHNRDSKYPLQGKHKELRCAKCHKSQPAGAPLVTTWFKIHHDICTRCHKKYPHKGIFVRSVTCEDCHDYTSWKKKKK